MHELHRLRECLIKAVKNKGKNYQSDDNKLFITDKICLELIVKIEEIEGVLDEILNRSKAENAKSPFVMPSIDLSSVFPNFDYKPISPPHSISKPPPDYISLSSFNRKYPTLISATQSHSYFHDEFKNSSFKTPSKWFVDEIKYLKFLLNKPLFRDRILANREKYASVLSL